MQMRMVQQILPPGVENGEEADFGAQMFGVAREGEQGFRSSAKENIVNRLLVL